MAPIPVVAAIVFLCIALFLLTFFSSFIRRYSNRHSTSPTATPVSIPIFTTPVTTPISLIRGLDQTDIDTFPTLDYSAVSSSYTVALECYVCLNEFQPDETLRLIPVCDHAFHVGCIDAWLSSNATCPVCRSNLTQTIREEQDHVVVTITVDSDHQDPPPLRRTLTWRNVSSGKASLARSKSTGRVADIMERFTLRVPEEVRREIIAGKLRRSRTVDGKSILRGGSRGEESGWRRWFFTRSKSMEVPKVTSASDRG